MPKFNTIIRGNNRLEVLAKEKGPTELVLIGSVGKSFWDDSGITESEVRDALQTVPKGQPINVRINSEGGSVQEGLGIYNAFKERRDDITAHVSGYALSVASIFPLAAHKVVSPKSAIWMLHEAHCLTPGNKRDKAKDVKMLAAHDETMAEIYAEKTGKPIEEIRQAMEDETWIRGSEAVAFGLADETDDDEGASASAYRPLPANYVKRCKMPAHVMNLFIPTPPASGDDHQNKPTSTAASGGAANEKMKAKIIALLKKHGVEVQDDWTDEQVTAALDKIEIAKSDNSDKSGKTITVDAALQAQIAEMKVRLDAERKIRIEAKLNQFIDEQRLTTEQKPKALARALADESYLEELALNPVAVIGGKAVEGSYAVQLSKEAPIFDIEAKEPDPAKRYEIIKADWHHLMADAEKRDAARQNFAGKRIPLPGCSAGAPPEHFRGKVLGSNTYSATLVTSFLMDGAVTNLQNVWAPLRAFSIDFTTDPYKPLATGVLKHVTAGSATGTDLTNFEAGNSTVAPSSVTMHQYSQPFQVSNSDLNNGLRMENLVTVNTGNFANKIIEVSTGPIDPAKFTTPGVQIDAANFGYNELRILQALLKKSSVKNLILDGAYMAAIANTPLFYQPAGTVGGSSNAWKAFGWDGVYNNTDWTGAAAKVQGFACHPQAIAGITGLPLTPPNIPGGILSVNSFTVPGLNVSVAVYMWFNPATRTMWTSYDIMLGVVEVDTTAGFIVLSP